MKSMLTIKRNQMILKDSDIEKKLNHLKDIRSQHPIWKNPLLMACKEGKLTFYDFQYLFSQYYLYSKNFSRLLAAVMVNCDSDFYRSKLAENLWEESGEKQLERRHAEIFRKFLTNELKIDSLDNIIFEPFTINFVQQYLQLCLNTSPVETAAALSLGTEGIVATLYTIFRKGLMAVGCHDTELEFFNIHIACDDNHAETLEEMLIYFIQEDTDLDLASQSMQRALDMRNQFFHQIYKGILNRRLIKLTEEISNCPSMPPEYPIASLKDNIFLGGNDLYKNDDQVKKINFLVKRIPFSSDVLDPRVVTIPVGHSNEYHHHAHETVFLIMQGEGEVIIEKSNVSVKKGDIVHIPRWLHHQTRNIGNIELQFFAVTDYGLTRRIPSNTEEIYRLNKVN